MDDLALECFRVSVRSTWSAIDHTHAVGKGRGRSSVVEDHKRGLGIPFTEEGSLNLIVQVPIVADPYHIVARQQATEDVVQGGLSGAVRDVWLLRH